MDQPAPPAADLDPYANALNDLRGVQRGGSSTDGLHKNLVAREFGLTQYVGPQDQSIFDAVLSELMALRPSDPVGQLHEILSELGPPPQGTRRLDQVHQYINLKKLAYHTRMRLEGIEGDLRTLQAPRAKGVRRG